MALPCSSASIMGSRVGRALKHFRALHPFLGAILKLTNVADVALTPTLLELALHYLVLMYKVASPYLST
jgi:hypothetical protein